MAELDDQVRLLRFDAFEANLGTGELFKAGRKLKFGGQPFQLLAILLERPGEVVTRDELQKRLWPDTFVDVERNLNTSINRIRDVLGDSAESPRYVETLPRRGYRFICPVDRDGVGGVADKQGEHVGPKSRLGGRVPAILIGSTLVAAVLALLGWRIAIGHVAHPDRVQSSVPGSASSNMRIVPLTSLSGSAVGPAFSPDGEKIAFFWNGVNPFKRALYVQLIGGARPLQITQGRPGLICCADWSPDGQKIAFTRCDDTGGGIYVVPALGGIEREMTGAIERRITDVPCEGGPKWTAEGTSLVMMGRCAPDAHMGIVVFFLPTGEKRCLDSPPPDEQDDANPILSPDRTTVVFIRRIKASVDALYTVSVAGGNLRRLISGNSNVWGQMWASDAQRVVFYSDRSGLPRLWRVPAAGGTVEPETVYPSSGTLSQDGRRLAYENWSASSPATVWRLELSRAGGQVVSQTEILASFGQNSAAQLSPDERQIAFESARSGHNEVWKSNTDGSDPEQLTSFGGHVGTPRWSPDGKWIAFDVDSRVPHAQIYVMDSEGRNQHSIVSGSYDNVVPSWSRDGGSVYFASSRTGDWQIWRRELATGRETQITDHGGWAALESYDAKTLYYSHRQGGGIWSKPVGGDEEQHITKALHLSFGGHFAVADAGLYLLDTEADPGPTIMYYNFQSRQLTPVFTLNEMPVAENVGIACSRDGRTILFAQVPLPQSSITMVENFQ